MQQMIKFPVELYICRSIYFKQYLVILIKNFSLKHPQVLVTADKSSDESYQLKELVRSVGTGLIREKLAQYIKELRQGNSLTSNADALIGLAMHSSPTKIAF